MVLTALQTGTLIKPYALETAARVGILPGELRTVQDCYRLTCLQRKAPLSTLVDIWRYINAVLLLLLLLLLLYLSPSI